MFNFKNSNSGKIRLKLLATLLVLTLTFANFSLVGSYIGEAIASEINLSSQGIETQSKNVSFDVYLDETDRTIKEKKVDINSDELKLYVSVNVQGGGYLNNPVIELEDTNFKFKNNPEITSVKLDSIQSEKGTTAGIPIVAKKDESYNLRLLDMQSQIKLTGEYIDSNGNVTDIDTTKAVKITWTADELTEEEIELSQEVITNKIYNIEGANKRVVQLLVKSKIKENKVPVKSSIIEITNPKIGGVTVEPVEVKVASYGTEATNGKNAEWSSTSAEGKTTITILNTAVENIVSWKKNCEDIFVLTYIYDYEENENVEISTFVSDAKSTIDIYGRTETAIEKTNNLTLEELAEGGNIVTLESTVTENIYKGKMYLGEDTNYQTKSKIYVPYSEIVDGIILAETAEEITEGVSTYYKATKINKADVIKVLGEDGIISICAEDITTPIKTINLATEQIEGEYYTVQYTENASKINIIMGNAQQLEGNIEINPLASEGTIEIINEKVIKVEDTEAVAELTELKSNTAMQAIDSRDGNVVSSTSTIPLVAISNTKTANLVEPKTTFDISLDKTAMSTQVENDLKITAELISKDESNKLYKNTNGKPVKLQIELPKEITDVSIESISDVIGRDDIELKSRKIITSENRNKVIVIELDANQTEYLSNSATITIDLKVKLNKFISNKNVEIKATCINDGENVESKENISLVSKTGLITKNTLTVGENIIQEVNNNNLNVTITENTTADISTELINNFGENITDINIVGNIPQGITLKDAISSKSEAIKIYYSEEQNASIDSQSWKTAVSDYSKIKTLKVTLDEMVNGSALDLNYEIDVNVEGLEENTSLITDLKIIYAINGQQKEEKISYVLNVLKNGTNIETPEQPDDSEELQEKAEITITPKVATNTIHEGQIVTYEIKVTNTSKGTLKNLTLDYAVPEGTVVTELTYAQGPDMTFTDNAKIKNKEWTIESIASNKTITKEITLRIKQGATEIINNISLKDAEDSVIAQTTTEPIEVIAGDLTVRMARRSNMVIEMREGSEIEYRVIVTNNTQSTMNNIVIKSQVPENAIWGEDEANNEWTYNSNNKQIEHTINSLSAGETKDIKFILVADRVEKNISEAIIENSAIVTYNGKNYATNTYTTIVKNPVWEIKMEAKHSETLNIGDKVKYIIKATNKTEEEHEAFIVDQIPQDIQVKKVTYYINEAEKNEECVLTNDIEVREIVLSGKTLTVEIEGVVLDIENTLKRKEITNTAKLRLPNGEYLESNSITNTILNDEILKEDEDINVEGTNSISGFAWIDDNKDGIRNNNENVLQAVEVMLLDKQGNKVAETSTSLTGTYKFNNLDKGEYSVAFIYDTEKYAVAKYQVNDANETNNSDAISKVITLDNENKTVGITDTIKLNGQNIKNIDIGLVENPEFDLSLNKYISKVVVTNNEGTSTYTYENTELAKIEIGAKYISGSVLLVEYEIEITNEGDVNGYATDIIDYLPEELEFNSEMNTEWYLGADKQLHYMALDPKPIEPGKTQTVKLVLTKTLKSNSTGTIENTAEIFESANLELIKDIDSTAGNKNLDEDDIGKASLIVSIRTGSPIMYIGIVIVSMLVLGMGIYIINKKVLKVRI